MTWAKFSDDFPDQCAQAELSDAAFRTHVEAICWCMRRENAGQINDRDVRRFAESVDVEGAVKELIGLGFWCKVPSGYEVVMGMEHQPEPEVIAARRQATAERQRRWRHKVAGLGPAQDVSRRDKTRDSRRDETRDPGRVGSGRDGTGKTSLEGKEERARESPSRHDSDAAWLRGYDQ